MTTETKGQLDCQKCDKRLGTAKEYGLELWQWIVAVEQSGWIVSPTITTTHADGTETTTEGYSLCPDHR